MASTSHATTSTVATMSQQPPPAYPSDSASPNTTFVQADPSTFRTIVQKLTGAPDDPAAPKLPVTHPIHNVGPKRPAFKLHERRQTAKKLEIKLNNKPNNSSVNPNGNYELCFFKQRGNSFLVSPVSTLEFLSRVSPRSPMEEVHARGGSPRELCEEEEERAIAEKGFYLHPSPLSTPRGAEPELLPLFPLSSPTSNDAHCSSN
ncbi:VQ motif-containing protein 11-like [Pistacia vera]|uniref:VQ motif-containing protein 11-like n=1 Tax=Pistacia vera TaxID=55513 RepID=UPI00126344DF|nr:VQ motif-containing protein 11-like [Pistacia vera]XP_031283954.1 VQ motif-containing protein 11-like [Pistacia vera]